MHPRRSLLAVRARTLRFMPQAALAVLDPIFNPTTIVTTHGYCVFDTLYGCGRELRPRPQMAQGHEVSADGLTWTIRLREGLPFHDGEAVRPRDCAASIRRWAVRDSFGQVLMRAVAAIGGADDRALLVRLHQPFPALLDALAKLATSPCFVMPERLASTPANQPVAEMFGSGPWRLPTGRVRVRVVFRVSPQQSLRPARRAGGGDRGRQARAVRPPGDCLDTGRRHRSRSFADGRGGLGRVSIARPRPHARPRAGDAHVGV